jgi:hypothetical protein
MFRIRKICFRSFLLCGAMESDHLEYPSYWSSVLFADCVERLPPVNLLVAIRVHFIGIALKFKVHIARSIVVCDGS